MRKIKSSSLFLAALSLLLLAAGCSDNGDGSNRYSDARLLNVKDSILLTNEETFTLKIFYAKGFHNMTSTVFTVEPADYKICKMTDKFCGMAGDSCIVYIQLQSGENFGSTSVKIKFHDILNTTEGGEVNINVVHNEKTGGLYTDQIDGVDLPMLFVEGGSGILGISTLDSANVVYTGTTVSDTAILTPEKIHKYYPLRTVKMQDYYISRTEVTCKLYKAVMGSAPHEQEESERGAMLSFREGQAFIKKLSKLTGRNYRIPTIDEWEYAAKGGQKSKGYIYPGSNNVEDVAWTAGNSGSHPTNSPVVAQKLPNELGVYDMAGGLYEWTNDSILKNFYTTTGTFVCTGYVHTRKGGSFNLYSNFWDFHPWCTGRLDGKRCDYSGLRLVISRKDYELKPVE